jgi:Acetyltransferase (GNAT) family
MIDILLIRPAAVDDMKTIISLIDQTAAWLGTKGTDQWAKPWPNEPARDGRVSRGIHTGGTWIVEARGEPVATVTYRQNGNQKLWTIQEQRDPAVYVSRLIVSRERAGDEIGAALIDWVGYRALKAWKAQWIRIDVWTTNIALQNYYKERKFRSVRVCEFEDPDSYPSAALFQKPTAEIDEAAAARFAVVNGGSLEPDRMLTGLSLSGRSEARGAWAASMISNLRSG